MRLILKQISSQNFRHGQAIVELVVVLIVLIIIISGISTLSQICLRQEHLQESVRLEAGVSALQRQTIGWVEQVQTPNNSANTFHQINAYTRLEDYQPALTSHLPMSHYTLHARTLAEGDLGLRESELRQTYFLDSLFTDLIYGKGTITLSETLTFPSTNGLWR